MKRVTGLILALCMLVSLFMAVPVYAAASGKCGDNLTWTYDTETRILTISGEGEMYDYTTYPSDNRPWLSYIHKVNKVIFEDGVTYIGANSIRGCDYLASAIIPTSVTKFGNAAFLGCSRLTTRIVIPTGTTEIPSSLFSGCGYLKKVTIPSTVKTIGSYAFSDCTNLSILTIPEGVETIGANAFDFCSSLPAITLPKTLKTIGDSAFYGSAIPQISIPASVTSIGSMAFAGCSSLPEFTVSESNPSFSVIDGVLFDKSGKTLLQYPNGKKDEIYIVPEGTETIGKYAFRGSMLLSIIMGEGVTTILYGAFYSSSKLESVVLPCSVTSIGQYAFYNCNAFKQAYYSGTESQLPSLNQTYILSSDIVYIDGMNLTNAGIWGNNIKWYAFDNGAIIFSGSGAMANPTTEEELPWHSLKSNIKHVYIDSKITSVCDYAFSGCLNLTKITLPATVTSLGKFAFKNSALKEAVVPTAITAIPEGCFESCSYLSAVIITNSVTSVNLNAFNNCNAFKTVYYNGTEPVWSEMSVSATGNSAFINAPKVNFIGRGTCGTDATWLLAGDGILTISGTGALSAFSPAVTKSKVKKIIIEEGITSVRASMFYDCDTVTEVSLPQTLTTIEKEAFYDCDKLEEIVIPLKVKTIGENAFYSCNALTTASVSGNSLSIGVRAFSDCANLKNLTLNNGVYAIGNYTFNNCTALESVSFPESLRKFGTSSFANTGLKEVVIGDKITTLSNAFNNCANLTKIYIGKAVNSLHYNLVSNSPLVTTITVDEDNATYCAVDNVLFNKAKTELILCPAGKAGAYTVPRGVTTIGTKAFTYCKNLSEITLYSDITTIGTSAFANTNITNINYYGTADTWQAIDGYKQADSIKKTFLVDTGIPEDACGENAKWSLENGVLTISGTGAMYDYGELQYAPWGSEKANITEVVIEEGITYIGTGTFTGLTKLNTLSIPLSLTEMGDTFAKCPLIDVYYPGTRAQWKSIKNASVVGGTIHYSDYYMCGDNLEWKFEKNTLTISGTGPMYDYEYGEDTPWYLEFNSDTRVVLEEGITYIGKYAFSGTDLYSISFPDSVKEIGTSAFASCPMLTNIDFNKIEKIGNYAFSNCSDPMGIEGISNLTLGDSVKEIGDFAFSGCESLYNVSIGKNVETIGNNAFKFTSINTIKVDPDNKYYSSYDNVLFNKNKTQLIKYPEEKNNQSYVIPDTVTEILPYALSNNEYLMSLTIPASVKKIGADILYSSLWFAEVYYYGNESQWNAIDIDSSNYTLQSANMYFVEPVDAVSYTLENGVLTVKGTGKIDNFSGSSPAPWSTFANDITSITVEEGITAIGNQAFASLPNVKTVMLPESLTSIGNYTFTNCKKLETVNMYGTTKTIGTGAFNGCESLTNININGDFEDYTALNIAKTNLPFERANITYTHENGNVYASMSIYARWAFDTTTKTLYITNYPYVASRDMLNYKNTDAVPWYDFINEIENVEVNGVSAIGSRSMIGATSLKKALIDDIVKRINSWAFYKCTSLETVKLGASITAIGTGAFNGTDSLSLAEFNNTKGKYDSITFGKQNNPIIRVTTTLTDGITGYQGGNVYWNIKDGVLTITGTDAMTSISSAEKAPWYEYRNEVTKIVIEKGITSVAKNAFNGFANLDTVEIGEGVTTIGTYAFKNSSVKTVYLPSTIQTVGTSSFSSCPNISNVIYNGTEADFSKVTIGGGNTRFNSATKTFK